MRFCTECRKTPWPFAIAMFIAAFTAFLTWLTLAAAGIDAEANRWWTVGVFVGVFGLLTTYMYSCMRRHCRHDNQSAHGYGHDNHPAHG